MNITVTLQKAINYMEDHLLDGTNYEQVANHLYMSNYHFHRLFSMIVGMSPSEYMRSRRLSLAGEEVILGNRKVVDIAFDYGYNTPESFSKAFTRFHGISPIIARRAGGELNLFNPLQIKLTLEGGKKMDYRIEKREPFKLIATIRQFDQEITDQEGNTDIPDFWQKSIADQLLVKLKEVSGSGNLYGVCGPVEKTSKNFRYGIGSDYSEGAYPEGLEIWEVKPTLWAVFKCIGETPDCIGDTWNRIFTEFLPTTDYEMLDDTDFEFYPENGEPGVFCEIWIPVGE